jgi:NTP pyrophosphatase (non-canonical NTP hydrolase)
MTMKKTIPHNRDALTFDAFRAANITRCVKWHPAGIESWSTSDWLTAVTGELGELASLIKMRNRERDGLVGNKFSPTDQHVADELADVLTYLDLLAHVLGVDLGVAVTEKFNQISERNGFSDRIPVVIDDDPWLPLGETPAEPGKYWRWIAGADSGVATTYPPLDTCWPPHWRWSRDPVTGPPPPRS